MLSQNIQVSEDCIFVVRKRQTLRHISFNIPDMLTHPADTPVCLDFPLVVFQVFRSQCISFLWVILCDVVFVAYGADRVDDQIRALKGPALMSMTPQTELADALLELVALRLKDSWYLDLLKRHYQRFKDALRSNGPPPLSFT